MKKLISIWTFFFLLLTAKAQANNDSISNAQKKLDTKIAAVEKKIEEVAKEIDTLKNSVTKHISEKSHTNILFIEWILIFSPAWVFVLALIIVKRKLKDFSLKDALTEEDLPTKTIPNPEYTTANINSFAGNQVLVGTINSLVPPTIEISAGTEYPESSSRYIALITSALTWIIVLCLSCFYLYQYIRTGISPDLTGLSTLLITLGIGIVPYAFNKMSKAIEK